MPGNRHTFSFVVDGIQLSDSQKDVISKAVGEAGAAALTDSLDPTVRCVIGPYFLKYRGKPAFDLQQIADTPIGEVVARMESSIESP